MTYCLAASVDAGLVFVSDSRTNAGIDQLASYSKMHAFCVEGERSFVLLSAGNLGTTQAVITQLRHGIRDHASRNLNTLSTMSDVADYVGEINLEQQEKHRNRSGNEQFSPEASFLLGGQIAGMPPRLFLIYPEGNYVHASPQTPFLQIGETKYGKPILDRVIHSSTPLEAVARCGLVSMDSTMRSNASVGPPIEVLRYPTDSLGRGQYLSLGEDDDYFQTIRDAWEAKLREAFNDLPPLKSQSAPLRQVVQPPSE